jgi:hypothetical protein
VTNKPEQKYQLRRSMQIKIGGRVCEYEEEI